MEFKKYDLAHYPQLEGSPCINMDEAQFSAYIKEKRKEFEEPGTHCRHGHKIGEACGWCEKLNGDPK